MLGVTIHYCYAECGYTECRYAECRVDFQESSANINTAVRCLLFRKYTNEKDSVPPYKTFFLLQMTSLSNKLERS